MQFIHGHVIQSVIKISSSLICGSQAKSESCFRFTCDLLNSSRDLESVLRNVPNLRNIRYYFLKPQGPPQTGVVNFLANKVIQKSY